MKVVFCSNFMNHHQLYLSLQLLGKVDYNFIACQPIEQERLKLGYEDLNAKYDWVIRTYESKEQLNRAKKVVKEADLVIVGSFPYKLLFSRLISNKPIFIYSERWFKNGNSIKNFLRSIKHGLRYSPFFNTYLLCSSAYTAYDSSVYHYFKDRCYKWGYFPHVEKLDIDSIIKYKRENNKIQLLWVGRFLDWKHPEYPIELAEKLKKDGYDFDLNMIGVGEELENIKAQIVDKNLLNNVHLLGSMPTEEVRKYMHQANIFLFTSDFNEGWGAVLNEAMNSGCAVVASHAIGSVPFLIEDGENGFIYTYGNKNEFYTLTKKLIDDIELRESVSKEAYLTLVNEWNPDNAAKKLLMLYDKLINKKDIEIPSGVCSKAEILDNNWRK